MKKKFKSISKWNKDSQNSELFEENEPLFCVNFEIS